MPVAAGMDAQEIEAKPVGDVDKAAAALVDEEDPANKAERRLMWEKADKRLHSFRMQQVAGGEDPSQAARLDLHDVRQQGVRLAGGAVQGLATRAGRGPRAWARKGTCACPAHQGCTNELRSVVSPSWRSCHARNCRHALSSTCGAHKHTTHAVQAGQGMLLCDGREISKRSCLGLAMINLRGVLASGLPLVSWLT